MKFATCIRAVSIALFMHDNLSKS